MKIGGKYRGISKHVQTELRSELYFGQDGLLSRTNINEIPLRILPPLTTYNSGTPASSIYDFFFLTL